MTYLKRLLKTYLKGLKHLILDLIVIAILLSGYAAVKGIFWTYDWSRNSYKEHKYKESLERLTPVRIKYRQKAA